MKTKPPVLSLSFRSLSAIAAAFLSHNVHAAVSITASGASESFDTAPTVDSWSTSTATGDQATFVTAADIDTFMSGASAPTAASINTGLVVYDGSTDPLAGYDADPADLNIVMRPTGNGATILLATLQNDTGALLSEIGISYDFDSNPESTGMEEIPGWRAYYSLSGDGSDWQAISDFSGSTGTKSTTLNFAAPVPNGGNIYLVWLDDNSPGVLAQDDTNTLDNFVVTVVPEPSSILLLTLGGLGLIGRRRH